ncbi:MAG TPA: hypothetical protein H9857_01085 [Candidatus Desulfovibrio intestinigallinarum]|nr:hypothetical protein [Candidatus Desulfovibrio intestinigallinarum]
MTQQQPSRNREEVRRIALLLENVLRGLLTLDIWQQSERAALKNGLTELRALAAALPEDDAPPDADALRATLLRLEAIATPSENMARQEHRRQRKQRHETLEGRRKTLEEATHSAARQLRDRLYLELERYRGRQERLLAIFLEGRIRYSAAGHGTDTLPPCFASTQDAEGFLDETRREISARLREAFGDYCRALDAMTAAALEEMSAHFRALLLCHPGFYGEGSVPGLSGLVPRGEDAPDAAPVWPEPAAGIAATQSERHFCQGSREVTISENYYAVDTENSLCSPCREAFDAFFKQEKARIDNIVGETDAVLTQSAAAQAKRLAKQPAPQHDTLQRHHGRLRDTLDDIRALKQEL